MAIRFSPLENDLPSRWQRRLGLMPPQGLATLPRALGLALFAWLPILGWALLQGRALPGTRSEALFAHYGVVVTCVVAIPLLVLCEELAEAMGRRVFPQFVASELVQGAQKTRFEAILHRFGRVREHMLPWLVILSVVALVLGAPAPGSLLDLTWARKEGGGLGFGGLWFLWVARPIYLTLLLAWLWRLLLMVRLCERIARLDLRLVPTHPDRSLGLAFLEELPEGFSLVALSVSSVLSARWAYLLVDQRVSLAELKQPFALFLVLATLLLLSPLLAFAPKLIQARRRALRDYGALVGRHGHLVHQRWIEGRSPDSRKPGEAILDAPELGPVADVAVLYESVRASRRSPVSLRALLTVLVPLVIPPLVVLATQIPLQEILLTIGEAIL